MKKSILTTFLLIIGLAGALASDPLYLFAYFENNKTDGLHLAWSADGMHWKSLNNGKPVFVPQDSTSNIIFRDPSIALAPDSTFHLVWTSMGHSRSMGYASSKDLRHWSFPKKIPVMDYEPTTLNVWAPEIYYDQKAKIYYIFWSSTIPDRFTFYSCNPGDKEWNHRIYYTSTRDFKTFTPTRLYYNPDFNIIDPAIVRDPVKKDLIMVLKNENADQKNIRIVRSKNFRKGFSKRVSKPITGDYAAEGPSAMWVGDTLYVYFDKFREGRYGAVRSTDHGKHWQEVTDQCTFPTNISHGTPIPVDRNLLISLFPEIKQAIDK